MSFKAKFTGLLFIAFFLLACNNDATTKLTKQKPAPSFELQKLEGGLLRFPSDTKGKIVAISFWADWCAFCKTELRGMEPIYQKYGKKDLAILAINIKQDKETAAAFLSDIKPSFNVLLDTQGKVTTDYGVSSLPVTFIIDRKGNLHTQIIGEFSPEAFEHIIKEMLKKAI